jgi:SHS family lactate transporter-like MFS transporter
MPGIVPQAHPRDTPGWQFAVSAAILGWILDAFNFFIVVFLFGPLAATFHVSKAAIVFTLTATLALRPVGALVFGALADRYGRKLPLIACVVFFTVFTVFSGYAPNYWFFLVMRALYGIGMGGYWGIGASYAMESCPQRSRGVVSGFMQGGYPIGYLLAAVAMQVLMASLGWRAMFLVGCPVMVVIVILTLLAPESGSWKLHRSPQFGTILRALFGNLKLCAYTLVLMAAMNSLSHGSQDLYPNFLRSIPGLAGQNLLGMKMMYGIPIVYNAVAVLGTLFFGHISDRVGRRRAMMIALLLCLISIPAWAFGVSMGILVLGSCAMQAGVQGAFGVIPAHLSELSPDSIRSLFPGLLYQLGVLIASPSVTLEYGLRDRIGYPWALTTFECVVIVALLGLFFYGPEKLGKDFNRPSHAAINPSPHAAANADPAGPS